jgi:hypothetical protein
VHKAMGWEYGHVGMWRGNVGCEDVEMWAGGQVAVA